MDILVKVLLGVFILLTCIYVIPLIIRCSKGVIILIKSHYWRKNIQVGDECFFLNVLGSITPCTVERVQENSVMVKHTSFFSSSTGWHDKEDLYKL